MSKPQGATLLQDPEPFDLEYGSSLGGLEICYESWGSLSPHADNAVLVCPAFSAHSHASSHDANPEPGWWEGMIGPGKALDSERYFVLCPALLGGTSGTTGPCSREPGRGRPWAGRFPAISVRDIVGVHLRLLDLLGIRQLQAVVGGSLGGMQVIELALRAPERCRLALSISATDYTRPYTAAIRHLGRQAILLDPAYRDGEYGDTPPAAGLRLARQVGTLYYRSREEFNERFPHAPIAQPSRGGVTFDVQSYLDHQGRKAVGRFDANSYLTLSLAMDLHDVWRGHPSREQAMAAASARFVVVGVPEDRLIPIDEQRGLHEQLVRGGCNSEFRSFSSRIGHDAFLAEIESMGRLVKEALDTT